MRKIFIWGGTICLIVSFAIGDFIRKDFDLPLKILSLILIFAGLSLKKADENES